MEPTRLPRMLFNAIPIRPDGQQARRPQGKPRMNMVDSFGKCLDEFKIDKNRWYEIAQTESEWTKLLDNQKIAKPKPKEEANLKKAIQRVKDNNSEITYINFNPKKVGSKCHERFERYKTAKTYREFKQKGGTDADFTYDSGQGFVTFLGHPNHRQGQSQRQQQRQPQPQQQQHQQQQQQQQQQQRQQQQQQQQQHQHQNQQQQTTNLINTTNNTMPQSNREIRRSRRLRGQQPE